LCGGDASSRHGTAQATLHQPRPRPLRATACAGIPAKQVCLSFFLCRSLASSSQRFTLHSEASRLGPPPIHSTACRPFFSTAQNSAEVFKSLSLCLDHRLITSATTPCPWIRQEEHPPPKMSTFRHRALRYFWDPEPRNEDPASMIWCLGKQYDARPPKKQSSPQPSSADSTTFPANVTSSAFTNNTDSPASTWPPAFLDDFESRIWMTYRSDFSTIPRSPSANATRINALSSPAAALQYAGKLLTGHAGEGFSSDVGWGCMIRSAQSVFANALLTLHLSRGTNLPFPVIIFVSVFVGLTGGKTGG
jgi:hypothetical protein